jgi:hypothetical protein
MQGSRNKNTSKSMSSKSTGNILVNALKELLIAAFKICAITLAWAFRLSGVICTRLGETIEKMITKRA